MHSDTVALENFVPWQHMTAALVT